MRWIATVFCIGIALGAGQTASAQEGERPASSEYQRLSTETFREPEVPPVPHWELLRLPETVTRLAVSPLIPLVRVAERTRLDRRIEDILVDHDKTRLLLPVVVAFTRDGYGAGFQYWDKNLLSDGERLHLKGIVKSNRDWEAYGKLGDKIPFLDGRMLSGLVELETDHNDRYYGLGNDTDASDERALFMQTIRGRVEFEVAGPGALSFDSVMSAGWFRQELGSGDDASVASLEPGGDVALPVGFDQTRDYVEVGWSFAYDQRDTEGRTNRGTYYQLDLEATHDLDEGPAQSGAGYQASVAHFIPVLPRNRVLVLILGTAATTPWASDEQVPLQSLVTLGRTDYLRGYAKRRFRDRTGWWGSVEYRYPIFDFRDTGAGLSSTLFVDVGRVGDSYEQLGRGPVRYSGGLGVRGETAFAFVFRAQVGLSPEGAEWTFSINESL